MNTRQAILLQVIAGMEWRGGYFTRDKAEHKRILRLQAADLVKYVKRGYPFYNSFFTITERGHMALVSHAEDGVKAVNGLATEIERLRAALLRKCLLRLRASRGRTLSFVGFTKTARK